MIWIHRNLTVHNSLSRVFANERKDNLTDAIDEQLAAGTEGLRMEDKWLMEVDLNDLTGYTKGEKDV